MRTVPVMLYLLLAACAGEPIDFDDAGSVDAGEDAARDASSDAGAGDAAADGSVDAGPEGGTCTCSVVGPCCDGCHPVNVGQICTDAYACTAGTTCTAAGTCGAGVATTCSVTTPACQAAACAEPGGCSVTPRREGETCDDGNAATFDDRCAAGACVGTACECAPGSGPCCDGCFFRPASHACIDDGPVSATCTGTDVYGGLCPGLSTVRYQLGDRFCTGSSSACTGAIVPSASSMSVPCEPGGSGAPPYTVCRVDAADPLGARCATWCE